MAKVPLLGVILSRYLVNLSAQAKFSRFPEFRRVLATLTFAQKSRENGHFQARFWTFSSIRDILVLSLILVTRQNITFSVILTIAQKSR